MRPEVLIFAKRIEQIKRNSWSKNGNISN